MSESAEQIFKTYLGMPAGFWVKILIAAVVLLVLFTVLRKLARAGQIITTVLVLLIMGVIGFKWVRDRDEPEFMTPVVNFVASFFPRSHAAPPPPN